MFINRQPRPAIYGALVGAALLCGLILTVVDGERIRREWLPSGWDETAYIVRVCTDRSILKEQGLVQYLIHLGNRGTPPAFRVAAFPVIFLTDPNPVLLRSVALLSLMLSALLLFLAGQQIASVGAGIIWASAFAFSTGPFLASMRFGTETTLYPAIACCLYAVARWFRKGRPDAVTIIALALSTGVGALSKASFFVIFVPLVGVAMLVAPDKDQRSWRAILGAIACGILVAIPWWLVNGVTAFEYALYASGFSRHDFPWATEATANLLGVPFMISFLVFLAWVLARARTFWKALDKMSTNFILACLAGCLPLTLLHFASVNHNMRLLTPALIPLTGIVAVLFDRGSVLRPRLLPIVAILVLVAQTGAVAWASVHEDQWDWERLRKLTRTYGVPSPAIVHLGLGIAFNPFTIQYPWICQGERVSEQWLWHYEEGPIDWGKVDEQIDRADIVLTVPNLLGVFKDKQYLDNQHNAELAERLRARSDTWEPVTLDVGRDSKMDLLVFLRRSRFHL